jgi:CRISPR-associated protein Csb2
LAHSRHYMPLGILDKGKEKTTLVLDAWAEVGKGELQVHWDLALSPEQRELLGALVAELNYLGRSESWVEGRLLPEAEPGRPANVLFHEEETVATKVGDELVFLAAPVSAEQFKQWRGQTAPLAQTGQAKQTQAQMKALDKAAKPYPVSLVGALQWDTSRWKGFGWSQPPGMQMLQFRRAKGLLEAFSPARAHQETALPVDLVLFALASPSKNTSSLPVLSRSLPQAELLHKSLVSCGGRSGRVPPVLSGCAEDRNPLKGHGHAHVLPLDLDKDGHLDHALLWAPMGFDREALAAIGALKRTWAKGVGELRVAMAGQALRDKLQDLPDGLADYLSASKTWVSLSPFVPPRFVKRAGANGPEGQIKAELISRGLPVPSVINIKPFPELGDLPERQVGHFRHYMRRRQRGGSQPPQDLGWFVHLEFEEPVQGPLCLGYGSHFGMGLFVSR